MIKCIIIIVSVIAAIIGLSVYEIRALDGLINEYYFYAKSTVLMEYRMPVIYVWLGSPLPGRF